MSIKSDTTNTILMPIILLTVASIVIISIYRLINQRHQTPIKFDGQRAYRDVQYQVDLGPRTPGSKAHENIVIWIQSELKNAGWQTRVAEANLWGHPLKNIIAKREEQIDLEKPFLILGAHYDSRLHADQDPDPAKRLQPVPGANDGASGVAVLLELARILPPDLPRTVQLVFFDAEDNGNIEGWDWILGSQSFVENLDSRPDAVVIIRLLSRVEDSLNDSIYCLIASRRTSIFARRSSLTRVASSTSPASFNAYIKINCFTPLDVNTSWCSII